MPTEQEIFFGLGFSVSKPGARDRASENVMRTLRSKEVNNTDQFYPFKSENRIGCEGVAIRLQGSLKHENELKHHENFFNDHGLAGRLNIGLKIKGWLEDQGLAGKSRIAFMVRK